MATAQKAQAAATTMTTVATKALSTALKSIGIGLLISAVAALITNWKEIYNYFTETVPALKKVSTWFDKIRAVAVGVGTAIINYMVQPLATFVKVVNDIIHGNFSEIGKHLTEGLKNTFDVVGNYQKGYYKELERQQEVHDEKTRQEQKKANEELLKDEEARYGKSHKRTQEYLRKQLALTKKGTEEYKELQRQLWSDERAEQEEKSKRNNTKAVKDAETDIAKARVDAMRQGMTKTLAELDLERRKRIEEVKKSGRQINEQIALINKTYEQKVFDARVQFHLEMLKEERNYWDALKRIEEENSRTAYENSLTRNQQELDEKKNSIPVPKDLKYLTIDYNSQDVGEAISMLKRISTKDVEEGLKKYERVLGSYINMKARADALLSERQVYGDYNSLSDRSKKDVDELNEAILKYQDTIHAIEKEFDGIDDFVKEHINVITEELQHAYIVRITHRNTYNNEILEYTKDAAEKELKLEKEKLDAELKLERDAEEKRHKEAISSVYDKDSTIGARPRYLQEGYKTAIGNNHLLANNDKDAAKFFEPSRKAMDEWLNNLKEKTREGKVTWDEYIEVTASTAIQGYLKAKTEYEEFLSVYNKMSAKEKADNEKNLQDLVDILGQEYVKYLQKVESELEQHNTRMNVLTKQGELKQKQLETDNHKARQTATATFYSNMQKEYDNVLSSISQKIDKSESRNAWGFINFKKTKSSLKDLEKTIDKALIDIAYHKAELVRQYKNKEISFEDFEALTEKIKALETQLKEARDNIKGKLGDMIDEQIATINNYVQQVGQAFSQVLSTVWDAQDFAFDKAMDALDKEIDEYSEKMDKWQEIADKHADSINSIEEELADARGDRRENLIKNLNAEIAAQRAALEQEKQAEKEKEALERKKEREELEQKKRELERQKIQAAISGALTIMNALATQPFVPVGLAMGALATTMTAAQLAIMNSMKYKDGGVIQGNSHSHGGVKVLGGRAEVEGGEFITNRKTTELNLDLLEYVNEKKHKVDLAEMLEFYSSKSKRHHTRLFNAAGGALPSINYDIEYSVNDRLVESFEKYAARPTQVEVVEILNKMDDVNNVRVMAGLS